MTSGVYFIELQELVVQAYLGDIPGSVSDHCNKGSYNLFAGRGSCLQFVNNTSMKCNKVRHNKMRFDCIGYLN